MHILGFQAVLVTRSGYRKFCNITICIFIPDIHVLKMKMYSNVHFEVCEAVLSLSLPLVHATCPCYLSLPLVLATCPCHLSLPLVLATCSCHLSLPLVLATCPCHLSLPLVLVRCFFMESELVSSFFVLERRDRVLLIHQGFAKEVH